MLALLLTAAIACIPAEASDKAPVRTAETGTQAAPPPPEGLEAAVFAGGCFWCMEGPFESVLGVKSVESGYTGGAEPHPTYEDVGYHRTTHYEANRVVYDPRVVTYDELLQVYWHNIDPTQSDGQFCDHGDQYRSAVFTDDPAEKAAFQASKAKVREQLGEPVATKLLPEATFWVAEEYHQDYYRKNPSSYLRYRKGCGRDARLKQLWGEQAGGH
ncbi:MAG: peptide-methionine (S)-S-oxide reductase MsrA [Myxococcota bacterium]|nr:peptide-methionine (S)-S-oxide reductase MsrA [Myxococcota bacterium]